MPVMRRAGCARPSSGPCEQEMPSPDAFDFFDVRSLLSDEERSVQDGVARFVDERVMQIIGCFGLTEPDGGSDPGTMKTHAKRQGGDWVINGAKMWITNGGIADLAIVWARTDEGGTGVSPVIRGFVVERGMPGYTTRDI